MNDRFKVILCKVEI